MRLVIVLLSAVVIGLAVSILLYDVPAPSSDAPEFHVARLISDANDGEEATYVDGEGTVLHYRVEKTIPASPERPPSIHLKVTMKDRTGSLQESATYDHLPTVHSFFPLTAPSDPLGLDRLWIWRRIRRETIEHRGAQRPTWRVDCIDPALPPDADTVVAWFDEKVPVFGLVRWQRAGRTWNLAR